MSASSKKEHTPFNRSVYSPMNKCGFIPNCAFEVLEHTERYPDGLTLNIYASDTGQYKRAVMFKAGMSATCGFVGVVWNTKTKEILWQETNPADQGKGYARMLRHVVGVHINAQLWAQHLTTEGMASHGHKQ
jgi:hypothetical protein